MKVLTLLARLCAVLAGVILTGITLVTCVSLIGRNTIGTTLVGDYELTAAAAGAAVELGVLLEGALHGRDEPDAVVGPVKRRNRNTHDVLNCLSAWGHCSIAET